jgi:hypothetical protein
MMEGGDDKCDAKVASWGERRRKEEGKSAPVHVQISSKAQV